MANASATLPSIRVGPCAAALGHSWCAAYRCEHALTAAESDVQCAIDCDQPGGVPMLPLRDVCERVGVSHAPRPRPR
jgi:hypothetical protein